MRPFRLSLLFVPELMNDVKAIVAAARAGRR